LDNQGQGKFLIIKPSSLGDIIHALPVAAAIKAGIPDARIDWVAGKGYEEILEGNPAIRSVITFDRGMLRGKGRAASLLRLIKELRRERYDAVIDLQGLIRSALMAITSRSPRRIGFGNAREGAPFFYTDKITVPEGAIHAVDRYMLALAALGLKPGPVAGFHISISTDDEARADAVLRKKGIRPGEPFIAVTPSARWTAKRWPLDRFIEVSELILKEKGIKYILLGSSRDKELFKGAAPVNSAFGETSLKGLAAVLKRAKVLLTNDSGPMHIAAAVGTPVAAIFGPTDPCRTGPYGKGHRVITAGMECSPCFRRECSGVKCLTGVTVEQVYNDILTMLER